jgi:hypothetical protein
MQTLCLVQGWVRGWWLDHGFGNPLLILSAQAEAAPLQLSRPLQGGRNACR